MTSSGAGHTPAPLSDKRPDEGRAHRLLNHPGHVPGSPLVMRAVTLTRAGAPMEATATIQPRMPHVATLVPEAAKAMYALSKSATRHGLPETTKFLVYLRASQINGCTFCAEMHGREVEEAGESGERICTVAGFREAP